MSVVVEVADDWRRRPGVADGRSQSHVQDTDARHGHVALRHPARAQPMTDELPNEPSSNPVPETPPPARARRRRWKWVTIALVVIIGLPGVVFAAWSWISLSYTYSKGDRAGYVQKFSHKGW